MMPLLRRIRVRCTVRRWMRILWVHISPKEVATTIDTCASFFHFILIGTWESLFSLIVFWDHDSKVLAHRRYYSVKVQLDQLSGILLPFVTFSLDYCVQTMSFWFILPGIRDCSPHTNTKCELSSTLQTQSVPDFDSSLVQDRLSPLLAFDICAPLLRGFDDLLVARGITRLYLILSWKWYAFVG